MSGRRDRTTAGGVASNHALRLSILERALAKLTKPAADPGGLYTDTTTTTGGSIYTFGDYLSGAQNGNELLTDTPGDTEWFSSDDPYGTVTLPAGDWFIVASMQWRVLAATAFVGVEVREVGGATIIPYMPAIESTTVDEARHITLSGVARLTSSTAVELYAIQTGVGGQAQIGRWNFCAMSCTLVDANIYVDWTAY